MSKVYTLTWRTWPKDILYKNPVRRCRFEVGSYYWIASYDTAIGNFCRLIPLFDCLRLIKCGRLVARAATYQGV